MKTSRGGIRRGCSCAKGLPFSRHCTPVQLCGSSAGVAVTTVRHDRLLSPPLRLAPHLRLLTLRCLRASPTSLALLRELSLFCARPACVVLRCPAFARAVCAVFVVGALIQRPPRRLSPLLVYPYKRGGRRRWFVQVSVLVCVWPRETSSDPFPSDDHWQWIRVLWV